MSSCESDCICCCLPCIVGWACIYFAYSGVRGAGRFCYRKCCGGSPEEDQDEKNRSQSSSRPTMQERSHPSRHRSHDIASSITQIQEPEKAYYSTDHGFKSQQPLPIDQMTMGNSGRSSRMLFVGGADRPATPQSQSSNPHVPLPSPTLSVQNTLSSAREAPEIEPVVIYQTPASGSRHPVEQPDYPKPRVLQAPSPPKSAS